MKHLLCMLGLTVCLPAATPARAEDSPGGTIAGTVTYQPDPKEPWRYARYYVTDAKKGTLAEAVVCLTDRKLKGLKPSKEPFIAHIDQADYRFIPETVAVRSGDKVRFTNSDASPHNVMALGGTEQFNMTLTQDGEFLQSFNRAGNLRQPVKIGCSFHSQMQAWIFVFDHPFFAVTAEDGKYRFEDVPPGEYSLELMHPAGRLQLARRVTVTAGQTVTLDLRTTAADLIK